MAAFTWTKKAEDAAIALANGETREQTAVIADIGERTLYRWLLIPEFNEEVDRLTFMTGVAHKAERLRLAKRIVRTLELATQKDLLDWLKYIQGETDGIKLDFTELLNQLTGQSTTESTQNQRVAGGGQDRMVGTEPGAIKGGKAD